MDNYLYKGLRKRLVNQIIKQGISDKKVLDAIEKVPRHLFMESSFSVFAYKNKAFPIGSGQTISQPYTVAFQTEILEVEVGDKILEIGTGSGYQTAILSEMGAKVFTLERYKNLYLKAKNLLTKLGYKANLFYKDGTLGMPNYAPFDKILVTAGAKNIPKYFLEQLKIGGKLVIPVGDNNLQIMTRISKISKNKLEKQEYGNFIFVPLLKGIV
ncbi:MAG: protein-L-isoaspartate O-methyltransferase [Bacteroidetes bacterium 4572_128]|nr:MAG: protein-L-isoaspartate O-methyltransferase [Bacteroidetes bacterium 4572_128]